VLTLVRQAASKTLNGNGGRPGLASRWWFTSTLITRLIIA
jgi:hypothetical protein